LAAMVLRRIQAMIIAMLALGIAAVSNAGEPQTAAGQQLLLLRNGQALEGQISRSGDLYRVALPEGEIRVKAADVELLCRDLDEAYQRKRAAISTGSLQDHLNLAQWCERHKLYDHAAAELADAAAIAPGNPVVGFFQRRLQVTTEPEPERNNVQTANDSALANDDLERMIRSLPPKAVESFTQAVQPLLMNNCTAASCHGPQSATDLRLQRVPLGQSAGRRTTQRNISEVLRYVDRDNPLASRILTVPIAPHGAAKTPVFTDHQLAQYKRLVDWVVQLGPANTPEAPTTFPALEPVPADTAQNASIAATTPRLLPKDSRKARPLPAAAHAAAVEGLTRAASGKPVSSPDLQAVQAAFTAPVAPKNEEGGSSLGTEVKKPNVKRGAAQTEPVGSDAFDPEIFNRRYLKPAVIDGTPNGDISSGEK
jgi:hypothetical protein